MIIMTSLDQGHGYSLLQILKCSFQIQFSSFLSCQPHPFRNFFLWSLLPQPSQTVLPSYAVLGFLASTVWKLISRICFNSFSLAQFFLSKKQTFVFNFIQLFTTNLSFYLHSLCVRKRLLLFCDVSLCTWNFGQVIEIHPEVILSITSMLSFSWVCHCDDMK